MEKKFVNFEWLKIQYLWFQDLGIDLMSMLLV